MVTEKSGSKMILFEVYDTLLDTWEVSKKVNLLMKNKKGYRIWMHVLMEYCFVNNCIDEFESFLTTGKVMLKVVADELNVKIDETDVDEVFNTYLRLPIHDDVQEGLSKLRDNNYRIAALTNFPLEMVKRRMEMSGLISYFEQFFSAEEVQKFKPCSEPYLWAADKLECNPNQIVVVTSATWDIMGALNAGMEAAYINDEPIIPLVTPTYSCEKLTDLAARL